MSTQPPLIPAEQAAYVEIYAIAHNSELLLPQMGEGATCGGCQSMARAAVAAVETPIAIAALESAATALDELAAANARVGRGTAEGPWIAAGVQGAALHVRNLIRDLHQSLSRPTSEEH